ncbi:hypothetical protein AAFF_G00093710 [Aldrovandia affinis]|uniref:Uncharacterized protein n=1 Tax=Aldrovandia affinis TaxID=143900 RepID=A0AAD7T2U5_9TELE|nr:hypothetical protein AAFF_G00093710 [Aldrovandia affinis]
MTVQHRVLSEADGGLCACVQKAEGSEASSVARCYKLSGKRQPGLLTWEFHAAAEAWAAISESVSNCCAFLLTDMNVNQEGLKSERTKTIWHITM